MGLCFELSNIADFLVKSIVVLKGLGIFRGRILLLGIVFFAFAFTLNSQNGPAGIGNTTNNVLWLRSDQGTSTTTDGEELFQWLDISGNSNHANQADENKRPLFIENSINGLPSIRFGGNDINLVVDDNDNLDSSDGLSIFVVAQPDNIDTNPRGLVSKRVDDNTERAYSLFTWNNRNLYFDTPSRMNGTTSVTNDPQVLSAVFDGLSANPRSRVFQDGEQTGSGSTSNTSIEDTDSDLYIGIMNDNYGDAFRGDMSEVIIYRSALNHAERLIVETYLSTRYNIELSATAYSSTSHTEDFTGIGYADGDKYSASANTGSGILLAERNSSLDEQYEFVFTGHDGTSHGIDNSDLPVIEGVELSDRWERLYYIERIQGGTIDGGSTDIRIGFDFEDTGITPAANRIYYLLYRPENTGDFEVVTGGAGSLSDGVVWFGIDDENFSSGYYSIVKTDQEINTWYSFNDGDWEDYNTWSTNPDNPVNPAEGIPGGMDRVIIQAGKTVTVTEDGTAAGPLEVNSGVLDFGTTTGNSFSYITGQPDGTVRLAADNFPSGDASGFANAATGGTVEYYGSDYDLTTEHIFRHMKINLSSQGDELFLLADYTLNGDLIIECGELHIGNDSFTGSLDIVVNQNLQVQPQGSIRTGSADVRHQLNLYGDFTNHGDVQFTNRTSPNYTSESTNGIVDVNFLASTRNQQMQLQGPSRFYRIAIEKETSTYELYMEADEEDYFRLLGYANEGHGQDARLASNMNSLGLTSGTVRVGPNITVPRLNGSGNYNISESAVLWVDGGEVTKPSGTAVVVYGRVKVSAGTFNALIESGITTRLNGIFESTGGVSNLGQFRTSVFGTEHVGGYIQTGGYVTIDEESSGSNTDYYSFSLSYEGNAFTLTGGTLQMLGTNSRGAIFINSDPVNQNVSGDATMILEATNSEPFRITSRSPLPAVQMTRSGDGDRRFVLEGGTVGTNPSNQSQLPALELVTKGSLFIGENTFFNPKGEDVTIGRDYNIAQGSSYLAAGNTTTFTGATGSYDITVDPGAETNYFHNLSVNNPGQAGTLSGTAITVGNNLNVYAGTLSSDQTIKVRGNIINSGTLEGSGGVLITERGIVHTINVTSGGSYESVPDVTVEEPQEGTQAKATAIFNGTPSSGNPLPISHIVVTNTGSGYREAPEVTFSHGSATAEAEISTNHEIGGDGSGVFGNLEIDEEHPVESEGKIEVNNLTAKQTVTGTLNLTEGILDLGVHNLDLEGALSSEDENNYGETHLIRMAGNHGDGGLTRKISADGTYLYPLGTYNSEENANRYGWAKPTLSDVEDEGKVQINAIPRKLPTLSDDGSEASQRYLLYYWRVRHSGFSTLPDIHNRFIGYVDDFSWNGGQNNHIIGKVVDNVRYNDDDDDLGPLEDPVDGKRILNYSTPKVLETGEFTAGFKPVFQGEIEVFYSRLNNGDWYSTSNNWDNGDNWSFEPHNGSVPDDRPAAGDYPQTGDIAVIGYGGHSDRGGYHPMNILSATEVGVIQYVPHPDPPEDARISRVIVRNDGSHEGSLEAGIVEGPGVFQIRHASSPFPSIDADFSEFVPNEDAVFHFQLMSDDQLHVIPAISENVFPNLRIEGENNTSATIEQDFHVRQNFTIDGDAEFILHGGDKGDVIVDGELQLGDWQGGVLSFNSEDNPRNVEVGGIRYYMGRQETSLRSVRVLNDNPSGLEHTLTVRGDIYRDENSNNRLDLFTDNEGGNNVILELAGDGENHFTVEGSDADQFNLYRIIMNKGTSTDATFTINAPFTLNGETDGVSSEKALNLLNGKLILNNEDTDIDLSTGGGNFFIPSTSGLVVQAGRINVSGDNTGILLDGLLRAEETGIIDLDGGEGADNYIEYSASGNAKLEIADDAELIVGSQIRRGTSNPSGILLYSQSGGIVEVGKNAAPTGDRGVFEVINSGSRFMYTGGDLTVVRPQSEATEATVLLEPSYSSVGNTTLQTGNEDTPASSVFTIKSSVALGNLTISGSDGSVVRLKDRSLTIMGDLNIGESSQFDGAGNFNLTVNRHIFNEGTADLNVDTLFLRGTSSFPSEETQEITGETEVKNLVAEPGLSVTLQSGSPLLVTGNLLISSGQLTDGGNMVTVKGDVTNNASHVSNQSGQGGILFLGESLQRIYGSGDFGRLEIDNNHKVQLENSIHLNQNLTLTNGILHIQHHRLSLGQDADIVSGNEFAPGRMIAVYGGAFAPQGLRKEVPVVAGDNPEDPYDQSDPAYTWQFTFPVGSDDGTNQSYTPMELYVASNNAPGEIAVVPVNEKHITFSDPGQGDHVLHQYWNFMCDGLSDFTALHLNHYTQDAVHGSEEDYIGARLFEGYWSKYFESDDPPIEVVYEDENYIAFPHTGVGCISGDYTAGEPEYIPDEVPVYYSVSDGLWTDAGTWERSDGVSVPAGGPVGQRVHVRTAHTVTISHNYRRSYETTINGRLDLGSTINHLLGYMRGTGTLATKTSSVPAGDYEEFFDCGGGTMEYGGSGSYTLDPRYIHYNNLTVTGSETKTLPNVDITICGDLRIEEDVVLNTVTGRSIDLYSNIYKDSGAEFNAEHAGQSLNLRSQENQYVNGAFVDTGNRLNNLFVYEDKKVTLNGPSHIRTYLGLYNGSKLLTTRDNLITLNNSDNGILSIHDDSYIDGPLRSSITHGNSSFSFPVGEGGYKKITTLLDVQHTSGKKYWQGEYINAGAGLEGFDPGEFHEDIEAVSSSEYWVIEGPSEGSASLRLTLTGTSDIAAGLGNENIDLLRIVYWNETSGQWEIAGNGAVVSGTVTGGTITTEESFSFEGTPVYFTLASVDEVVIPTAQITSGDADLCEGSDYHLEISLSGEAPWEIDYSDGFNSYTNIEVESSPHIIDIENPEPGLYTFTIDEVRDNNGTEGTIYGSAAEVSVFAVPESFPLISGGDICGGGTTSLELEDSEIGINYDLYKDAEYYGITLEGTGGVLSFTGIDQEGTYTVQAYNSDYADCYNWMEGNPTIGLESAPTAEITGLISEAPVCDGEVVEIEITFEGTAPFTFSIEDNHENAWSDIEVNSGELSGEGPYTYNFIIPDPVQWINDIPTIYNYTIIYIEDYSGCGEGTIIGAPLEIEVYKIPETGTQFHIKY